MTISALIHDALYIRDHRSFLKVDPVTQTVQTASIQEIEELIFNGDLCFNHEVTSIEEAIYYFFEQKRDRNLALA